MAKHEEFLRQLRATFRVEAGEHLQAIDTGLEQIEKSADAAARATFVEVVFRAAHSLKGASRAVDFGEIETICQSLETLFSAWKRGKTEPTRETLDSAHVALGRIGGLLAQGESATPELPRAAAPSPPESRAPPPELLVAVPVAASPAPSAAAAAAAASPGPAPPRPRASTSTPADADTVRVSVHALDARLLEAEEMLAAKIAAAQRNSDLDGLAPLFEAWRQEWMRVQPEALALRQVQGSSLAEFLDWNQEWLRSLETRVAALRRAAGQDQLHVDKLVDDLLENSKKLLMLPLSTQSSLLRKVVRDLARELGKDAELVIHGEDTRMDKRILEEIKDPLVHLLRNSLDHGIESPEARAAAGKPARATITIKVSQVNGNQVEIAIQDDGAGIDTDRVRTQAVARGLLSAAAAEALDPAAAQALIFEADLSTSPMITQLSGRGLGLAIVREKAEKLGGRVNIESRRGQGATLRMTLPLTLATFRGVLVEASRRTFVVPTSQVERVTRFRSADIQTVEGRETLPHNGRALALAHLADVLELPAPSAMDDTAARTALILGTGTDRIAFAVDAVIDEREVLVKRLRKPLVRVRNIAGATVLGSGQVAPILNVTDLMRSARGMAPRRVAAAPKAADTAVAKRVLVAEDSITSRMLLKGILESAGYQVKTAVDGLEAFTLLRSEEFDVLVSDVEMPRLNGFDLTTRLRADRELAELPVILVTALASREDRERGIDVGANAYLVKSDLDQSNLLDALRRLA
jgi:two-component system chemotaxis sensor kinase CheA